MERMTAEELAGLPADADDHINADFFRAINACKEADSITGDLRLCEFVSKMMMDFAALAAAPVLSAEQSSQPQDQRELIRRLYVELFHCHQQMITTTDENDEPLWLAGVTVPAVLADAKAALESSPLAKPDTATQAPSPKDQATTTRLDVLSLIRSQMHRVYASAIDREEIDTKYMAEIEDALKAASSPIAEPDTATQAPSESINCYEFRTLLSKFADDENKDFGIGEVIAFVESWHQRATQAARPLTNGLIREILHKYSRYMGQPDYYSDTEFACLQDVIGFARAIELHLKGE